MSRLAGREVALYSDTDPELSCIAPIGAELGRRGARVRTTTDFAEPAEIGLYACHANRFFDFATGAWGRPPNALSALAVHDLGQAGGLDAGYFDVEPWGGFDLGLLPGPDLAGAWERAQAAGAARPALGMHVIGWPKMDHVDAEPAAFAAQVAALRAELGVGARPVVLLACSWVQPHHITETVAAIGDQDLDIVVKFTPPTRFSPDSPWRERLTRATADRAAAQALARAEPRVIVSAGDADIMALVALADVVVGNGSNVLNEGVLVGVPGVSIRDWEHPAGASGEFTVPPFIDVTGVVSGPAAAMADLLGVVRDPSWRPLVAHGAAALVEPATRGRAAQLAADAIEAALAVDADELERLRTERSVPTGGIAAQLSAAQAALAAAAEREALAREQLQAYATQAAADGP